MEFIRHLRQLPQQLLRDAKSRIENFLQRNRRPNPSNVNSSYRIPEPNRMHTKGVTACGSNHKTKTKTKNDNKETQTYHHPVYHHDCYSPISSYDNNKRYDDDVDHRKQDSKSEGYLNGSGECNSGDPKDTSFGNGSSVGGGKSSSGGDDGFFGSFFGGGGGGGGGGDFCGDGGGDGGDGDF